MNLQENPTHNEPVKQPFHNNLFGGEPKYIQVRLRVDLALRCWTCRAGAAGAGKFLQFFAGTFPAEIAKSDEVRAQTFCLSRAAEKIKTRFPESQIVSIEFNPENAAAPIARLEMEAQWAA